MAMQTGQRQGCAHATSIHEACKHTTHVSATRRREGGGHWGGDGCGTAVYRAGEMQQGGSAAAGGKAKEVRFTREELRQLFQQNGAMACDTRDLLQSTPDGVQ